MSTPCDQLSAFSDGELSPAEADAFRDHLAGCERCQAALMDEVQASLAVESLGDARRAQSARPAKSGESRAFRPARAQRRSRVVAASLSVAAVLAVVVGASLWLSRAAPAGALLLARTDTRPLEGRLGYPGLDAYRQLATMRGGDASRAELDHRALATLEERGDLHGVATAPISWRATSSARSMPWSSSRPRRTWPATAPWRRWGGEIQSARWACWSRRLEAAPGICSGALESGRGAAGHGAWSWPRPPSSQRVGGRGRARLEQRGTAARARAARGRGGA